MCHTTKRLALIVLIASLIVQFAPSGASQESKAGISNEQLSAILKDFKDPFWKKREEAFYKLLTHETNGNWDGRAYLIPQKLANTFHVYPDREDELKMRLIELLTTEDAVVEAQKKVVSNTGQTLSEEYTNYYGDLIAAVAGLGDLRAKNALIGAIQTGGMVERALAGFGPEMLDPLTLKLQSRDIVVRAAAVRVLSILWKPEYRSKFSDDESHRRIKAALLKASEDEEGSVRLAAVNGLALMPDVDTIRVLKALATSDPGSLPGQADDGGPLYYVRRAATKALDQIARTGTSNPIPSPR